MFVFPSGLAIGNHQILLAVKSNNFFERFVAAIEVAVFDIQHRIDPVRFQKGPKPILKSKAGE